NVVSRVTSKDEADCSMVCVIFIGGIIPRFLLFSRLKTHVAEKLGGGAANAASISKPISSALSMVFIFSSFRRGLPAAIGSMVKPVPRYRVKRIFRGGWQGAFSRVAPDRPPLWLFRDAARWIEVAAASCSGFGSSGLSPAAVPVRSQSCPVTRRGAYGKALGPSLPEQRGYPKAA